MKKRTILLALLFAAGTKKVQSLYSLEFAFGYSVELGCTDNH